MLSFFKTDRPPFDIQKIRQNHHLDKAKRASVNVFFEAWMHKKPRKAMVGTWFVLHQEEGYIYWGKPYFKNLFIDKIVVNEFFKTEKAALQQQFPHYSRVDGHTIRLRLQEIIKASNPDFEAVSIGYNFEASLLKDTININCPCQITENEITKNLIYQAVLDKNNLDLVSLQKY